MYYKVKVYPFESIFLVKDDCLDSTVSELLSEKTDLMIVGYISEEEFPETYVELVPHC